MYLASGISLLLDVGGGGAIIRFRKKPGRNIRWRMLEEKKKEEEREWVAQRRKGRNSAQEGESTEERSEGPQRSILGCTAPCTSSM